MINMTITAAQLSAVNTNAGMIRACSRTNSIGINKALIMNETVLVSTIL